MTNISKKIFELIEEGETEECKKFVTECGRDINEIRSNMMWTPLIEAIVEENDELVEFFLERGQDVNLTDNYGETALTVSAMRGEAFYVYQLLKWGANINHQNDLGLTALHYATNDFGVFKLLLDKEADTTLRISDKHCSLAGMTAPELAEHWGYRRMKKYLIDMEGEEEGTVN